MGARRNYKNALEAFARITRDEGIATLWRGSLPTVGRAMVLNAAQLGIYGHAKEVIVGRGLCAEGNGANFAASLVSGFFATAASIPLDMMKTQLQNMRTVNGRPEYSGAADVLVKVVQRNGVLGLWKGFLPFYMRLGPHTTISLMLLEQLQMWYKRA